MDQIHAVPVGDFARANLNPSSYVTSDALRDGTPNEREVVHLVSADRAFTVGIWSADPYREQVVGHDGYEYTFILEGQVTLTEEDGVALTFVAGEAFTIASGWSGEYRVDKPLLKHYAFYGRGEPSATS